MVSTDNMQQFLLASMNQVFQFFRKALQRAELCVWMYNWTFLIGFLQIQLSFSFFIFSCKFTLLHHIARVSAIRRNSNWIRRYSSMHRKVSRLQFMYCNKKSSSRRNMKWQKKTLLIAANQTNSVKSKMACIYSTSLKDYLDCDTENLNNAMNSLVFPSNNTASVCSVVPIARCRCVQACTVLLH